MHLFCHERFISHAGLPLSWKVECEALTEEDWKCLAYLIAQSISFQKIEGIPRGGLPLAKALEPYKDSQGIHPLLIVDDVFTTGKSMEMHRNGREARGVVVFSRTAKLPRWIEALWMWGLSV